jgi:predicted RNA-binding protein (virulence factor B family)
MTPKAVVGDIICLDVVDVNLIGAFLDWGLEKDLLLPFKHQFRTLKPGDKCLVKVIYDAVSDRIIATTKIMFTYDEEKDNLNVGDKVSIQVSDIFARETRVLVNGVYYGNIFKSEIYQELTVGDKLTGYLNKFRYDGKLDITLKPIGIKAVLDDKGIIINHLKESKDGFLPYNSKSSSEEIREVFKMSKKAFKKALGGLYKSRRITITDDGMKLKK